MSEELQLDYQALGLQEGSSLLEIEAAYQQMRSLYDVESLATYSLFDHDQRQAKLQSLEESYRRILKQMASRDAAPSIPSEQEQEQEPEPPEEPVDPEESPGGYLKQLRERADLSLRDVAESTKVGVYQLDSIERQRFDKLPAPVYLRGFVVEFARSVGAPDPQKIAGVFLEHFRRAGFA